MRSTESLHGHCISCSSKFQQLDSDSISLKKELAKFTANASQFSSVDQELMLIYSDRIAGASVVYEVSMDIKHVMKTLFKLSEY